MSTRAQVIITDGNQELWFYRHSDGYPEGTLPTLKRFMSWVRDGKIRDNVEQAAGWLIALGMQEYSGYKGDPFDPERGSSIMGWKVGAYEPCACRDLHGDVAYLYTLDLIALTIRIEDGNRVSSRYADGWGPKNTEENHG
jgi:hypothetical protein